MSIHIIIHKTNPASCEQVSRYLFTRLDAIFPGMVRSYHNGQLITVGREGGFAYIDFRCGTDYGKLAGMQPDFYYTDSDVPDILDMLEQSAAKCNGKKLDCIGRVINIIDFYMEMMEQIDNYLKESEE